MKAFLLAGSGLAVAQLGSLDAPSARPKQFVTYEAERPFLTAGKRGVLELRFQVQPGFLVNSHTPKSDLQIPTNVSIAPEAGVKVDRFEYPPGKSYSVSFDPGEKLDVYSDQFVIRVSVTATPEPTN